MSNVVPVRCGTYLQPIKSDDTPAVASPSDGAGFYTLGVGTYYVDLSIFDATYLSAHMRWNAALAATITFWCSDFSKVDASLTDTTAGNWIQEDPSTAYIPAGTGYTIANMTITVAGTDAGGTRANLTGYAAGRIRARIVVTVAGVIRVAHFGKV